MKEMFNDTSLYIIYVGDSWIKDQVKFSTDMFLESDKLRGFYFVGEKLKYDAYAGDRTKQESVNSSKAIYGIGGYLTRFTNKSRVEEIFNNMLDKDEFKKHIPSSVTQIIFGEKSKIENIQAMKPF